MIYTEKYVSKMIKEFENGKLYKGDCLEIMKEIADKSVDMILCDLPYGTTQNKWDAIIPFESLWEQYERIIKDNGAIVLTAAQPFTSALIMSNPKLFKYCWVWQKTQAVGHLNAYKMPMRKTEDIAVFYKKQPTYNYILIDKPVKDIRPHSKSGSTSNYGKYNQNQEQNRKIPIDKKLPDNVLVFPNAQRTIHPTQKPIDLMEYLIYTYSNVGEVVLDNCSGSGTTGIAAINTNRKFILIEQDDCYYESSSERIEKHLSY
jgi:site-specific DNA-methyltransferase (adenine-specific)